MAVTACPGQADKSTCSCFHVEFMYTVRLMTAHLKEAVAGQVIEVERMCIHRVISFLRCPRCLSEPSSFRLSINKRDP